MLWCPSTITLFSMLPHNYKFAVAMNFNVCFCVILIILGNPVKGLFNRPPARGRDPQIDNHCFWGNTPYMQNIKRPLPGWPGSHPPWKRADKVHSIGTIRRTKQVPPDPRGRLHVGGALDSVLSHGCVHSGSSLQRK